MKKSVLTALSILLLLSYHFGINNKNYTFRPCITEIPLGITSIDEYFSQLQQSVAALPDGGFAAVWVKGQWPHRDVIMQWLTPYLSTKFDSGGIIIGDTSKNHDDVVIVPHPLSGAFVAFDEDSQLGARIKVQLFDGNANPVWTEGGVLASPTPFLEAQSEPNLVPDPWGGVYVCFHAFNSDPATPDQIRCQHIDAHGNRMWDYTQEDAGGVAGLRVFPRGVTDNNGGLLVFWRNQRDPFSAHRESMLMEGQHFSPTGTKIWGEAGRTIHMTNLAANNGWSYRFYSTVSDGNGGAVLVFNDWTQLTDANLDVVAQRVSYDGTLLWGSGAVVTGDFGHQQHEVSIASGDGGAFVFVSYYLNETQNKLYVYRLDPDGQHSWDTSGVLLSHPSIVRLDYGVSGAFHNNLLILMWTHQLEPYSDDFDVMMARLTPEGTFLDPPGGITLIDAPDKQFSRDMVFNEVSRLYFAVWDDYRRSRSWTDGDVYGAGINMLCPHPPVNVSLRRKINRSLFRKEAWHTILWEPNPNNTEFNIVEYRIHRKEAEKGDENYQQIGSIPGNAFEYEDRYLNVTNKFAYVLTSVDSSGQESGYSESVTNDTTH